MQIAKLEIMTKSSNSACLKDYVKSLDCSLLNFTGKTENNLFTTFLQMLDEFIQSRMDNRDISIDLKWGQQSAFELASGYSIRERVIRINLLKISLRIH